ncbi:MAG: Nif3-like dinuclear metal center hexameric protein [Sphaerochaetaceae bacterium]|nr:Nif3-like dinuclear metal center hexameric protein [Sphaerochaetaceae bacterium]
MKMNDFVQRMTEVLNIGDYASTDISLNGLQVGDLNKDIHKVAFAVDASLATIKAAIDLGADLLFTHHGIFWGKPLAITGRHYDRVKAMLDADLALFACHLPLDCHPTLGNNAQMAMRLGMTAIEPFSYYRGVKVGYKGVLPTPMTADQIIEKLGIRRNPTNFFIHGDKAFRTVGIVSGEGAFDVYQAMAQGLDCLISGESQYSTVNDCLEAGMSMLCIGHYETETFGVKAVMDMVKNEYGLDVCFVDIPLGL